MAGWSKGLEKADLDNTPRAPSHAGDGPQIGPGKRKVNL